MAFHILVHDPDEDDWDEAPLSQLTLAEYSAQGPGLGWVPDLTEVGIRLVPADGGPWQAEMWAPLDILVPMCAQAAARLARGAPALIRSVQDAQAEWLLLDPVGDVVHLAVLRDVASPYASLFPIPNPPGWSTPADGHTRIYAYVTEHRAELLRPFDRAAAEHAHLRGRTADRRALVAALESAAELGEQVLQTA